MKPRLLIALLSCICFCCFGDNSNPISGQQKQDSREVDQAYIALQQENRTLKTEKQTLEQDVITLRNNIEDLTKQIANLNKQNTACLDEIAALEKIIEKQAIQIENQTGLVQKQKGKISELENQLSDSKAEVTRLHVQLKAQEAISRNKLQESTVAKKVVQDENEELKAKIASLQQKYKQYSRLFYGILSLFLIVMIAKVVLRIKRSPFKCHEMSNTTSMERQPIVSEVDAESSKKEEPFVEVAKELRCPRCGWKYNPGDKVCKNCKTIF